VVDAPGLTSNSTGVIVGEAEGAVMRADPGEQ
jgi:hypothetical protein